MIIVKIVDDCPVLKVIYNINIDIMKLLIDYFSHHDIILQISKKNIFQCINEKKKKKIKIIIYIYIYI